MIIDRVGIDPGSGKDCPAHKILLAADIILVECLAKLPPKRATVTLLPMKIEKSPEAPIRAFALI